MVSGIGDADCEVVDLCSRKERHDPSSPDPLHGFLLLNDIQLQGTVFKTCSYLCQGEGHLEKHVKDAIFSEHVLLQEFQTV